MDRLESRRRIVLDPDAVAYFAAASITDSTEKAAANTLIAGLKANGLWNKFDRIYLFSPTSLSAALYCAKSLTQMTAVNAPTHSSSGVDLDANTQYINTNYNPTDDAGQWSLNSAHLSVYINGSYRADDGAEYLLGSFKDTGDTNITELLAADPTRDTFASVNANFPDNRVDITPSSPPGFFIASRTDASSASIYEDAGTVSDTNVTATSDQIPTIDFTIGALNTPGGVSGNFRSNQRFAFASFGSGITTAEVPVFYALLQAYQSSLGRSVA